MDRKLHRTEDYSSNFPYSENCVPASETNFTAATTLKNINVDDFQYLKALGYSDSDISTYIFSWNNGILACLLSNKDHVAKNMMYLQADFNKELLLKLPVFYPSAFILPPTVFCKRFEMLKAAFPDDYINIVEQQFLSYDGYDAVYITNTASFSPVLYEPFLETLSKDEEDVKLAIDSLADPASRQYKFIIMLQKEIGLDVSPDDIREEYLLDLECGKWEVLGNVRNLIELGLPKELIFELLWHCPYILVYSTAELESIFCDHFGDNFIEALLQKYDNETLGDELCGLF